MTNHYRVRVNGEEFWASADELLLDAAIRNGVDIPHDCRSGQCGKCRVRPVDGKLLFRGEVVTEDDPEGIRACQSRVVSDVTLTADGLPEILSTSGQVIGMRELSPEIVEVLVAPSQPVTIAPGQYLNVAFDGFPARAFSPTVCLEDPSRPEALHFHIRRLPGGRVSAALGREIAAGHPVRLVGPFGSAHLQPGLTSRLILVAEGAGFASVWSIAAVALQEQPHRPIILVIGSRNDDFYMQPALHWLAAHPNVTITLVGAASVRDASSPSRFLADHLPELSAGDVVHVAGPEPTINEVMSCAQAAGAVCFAQAFAASDHLVDESSADTLLGAWRLRRARPFTRRPASSAHARHRADLDKKGWIRSRRGIDFYLRGVAAVGALLACSGLLLGALTPANPGAPAPSSPNAEQTFGQTASMSGQPIFHERLFGPEADDNPQLAMQAAIQVERDREWALKGAVHDDDAGSAIGRSEDSTQVTDTAGEQSFAGVWAPDVSACSARQNRKRLIPAVITADGASAGDTFCTFKNKRRSEAGLDVVANCSNPQGQWTTKVRLRLNGNRLTWSSRRGTQTYLRCEPHTRMAEAR